MRLRAIAVRLLELSGRPGHFDLTEALFLRLLGLVYLCAFASLWPQILGLAGSNGIVPASQTLTAIRSGFGDKAFLYVPSLLWIHPSDGALTFFCAAGCIASLLLVAGVLSRWTAAISFVLYLSLASVGQPFTSFQWDALLLEAGFLAIFAGAPWLVWAYRLLLFRLMFESGWVKLASHDANWRNLHALRFHFMTQPLPNPIAYYVYWAPPWLLDSLTFITLAIELGAPFLLFGPRKARWVGVALLVTLQLAIVLTGNYAFFNLLTLALCFWALDDMTFAPLQGLLRRRFPSSTAPRSKFLLTALNASAAILIVLGVLQLASQMAPGVVNSRAVEPAFLDSFEIVNSYGLFAVMTTSRQEIVLEGSDDGATWKEYSFRYKPGNLHRAPPLVAPYQPRLDWQMWFAALGPYQSSSWVQGLMYRLLLGDAGAIALLDDPPFARPPRLMRALIYDYNFTTLEERARNGAVWRRRLLGTWFGPVSLKE